jgi:hypothetical protein
MGLFCIGHVVRLAEAQLRNFQFQQNLQQLQQQQQIDQLQREQQALWDVMDHYNKGDGLQNPWLDEDIQPLALKENEIDDVVAFLASLTSDDYKKPAAKELARQRALSRTTRPQRDTARAFGSKPIQPKPPPP